MFYLLLIAVLFVPASSKLHRIDTSQYSVCSSYGTDAVQLRNNNHGICMQYPSCRLQYCTEGREWNLPLYSVAVESVADIQAALSFATQHRLPVTVKNSGHSYAGSSTRKDSLLIWMKNFPKYGNVINGFTDSCGTQTTNVLKIGGGAAWADAYTAADAAGFTIVGGGSGTVSAAGGWLQGGGLSALSRRLGLGVDNVLKFDVVLANGTVASADACQNTDLFWALRGGGGGTFAIVTAAYYRLHPREAVVRFTASWGAATDAATQSAKRKLMEFWLGVSPDLDNRWGGYWSGHHLYLIFQGSRSDAESTFINSFTSWSTDTLTGDERASLTTETTDHASYFATIRNPSSTVGVHVDTTGASPVDIAARLVPRSWVANNQQSALSLLVNHTQTFPVSSYLLGGVINNVATTDTAMHPAVRSAVWNIITVIPAANEGVRSALPNTITGACYNHASQIEPQWQDAFWGTNLQRLQQIKAQVDPANVLNCYHCVGVNLLMLADMPITTNDYNCETKLY
eukprot:TRINITY_DN2345_c0_g1_i1.p1 TRINITY_DN2345_c0_g1~~TRINITY_DN2345_c0_g1_i1.p1  ORF type:complete len:514 (+),score=61.64 TRINITY_DN2345_c0_g1_i1:77-1618(+)